MTTIQLRIDQRTKRDSAKILERLGLDISAAIKMYLRQVVLSKGIPFPVLTENRLTVEEEKEILKASREAKRGHNVTRGMTPKEAIAYLHSLK